MTHPESYAVGLLGLAMFAVGALTGLTVTGVAGILSYRFLPIRRRRTTYRPAFLPMLVVVAFALAVLLTAARAMQALAVIASFGWDAHAGGLHVINKHGQLSDGRYLGVFWAAASAAGTFLMMVSVIPAAVWHLHFNPNRNPHQCLHLTGFRLDGQPVPRALVTFHLVAGTKLRGHVAVETEDGGYEVHDLPLRGFRITVADRGALVPREYGDLGEVDVGRRWGSSGSSWAR